MNSIITPTHRSLRLAGLLLIAILAAAFPIDGRAQEDTIDFESIAANLPDWSGTANIDGEQKSWNLAKPDFPFVGSLDGTQPHSGLNSLKVEFTQDATKVGIMVAKVPVTGTALEFSFFIRSEGVGSDGIVSLYQYNSTHQGTQVHWDIAKAPESSSWTQVTCRIDLRPDTETIMFSISYPSVPAGAKLWLDDITLKVAN